MDTFNERIAKATILVEALPYLQRFRDLTVVIKYGGSAMEDPVLVESVLKDIVFLEAVGINPVIVHGGGKAISAKMKEAGLEAKFAAGLRVTDADSIRIVDEVLNTNVNPKIVENINSHGGSAVTIKGQQVFRCNKRPPVQHDGQEVDLGFVGELSSCEVACVQEEVDRHVVPVISPLAQDKQGQSYNINADTAAAQMAVALNAPRVIYLSDVNGILRDPENPQSRIISVDIPGIDELKADGTLSGGMLPKVDSFVKCLNSGVEKIHLIDGRIPHALLLELFTDRGIGTEIVRSF